MDTSALTGAGFQQDDRLKTKLQFAAEPLQATGPYQVLQAWSREDSVSIVVEQNTSTEQWGEGASAIVTYPPVAVVQSPAGRVVVNPDDTELILQVAQELSSA